MTLQIANSVAIAALDAATALLEEGTPGGTLVIYSGAPPAGVDVAIAETENDVLIVFDLPSPAFGAAADDNPGAIATANAIGSTNAVATGTSTFFRLFDGDDVARFQGTVTASGGGGDCIISTTAVVSGAPSSVISLVLRHPE